MASDNLTLDEAEAMIWALLDGQLTDIEANRLQQAMLDDEQVMSRYLECVQLEAGLREHFAPADKPTPGRPVTVLANLNAGTLPGLGSTPPVVG